MSDELTFSPIPDCTSLPLEFFTPCAERLPPINKPYCLEQDLPVILEVSVEQSPIISDPSHLSERQFSVRCGQIVEKLTCHLKSFEEADRHLQSLDKNIQDFFCILEQFRRHLNQMAPTDQRRQKLTDTTDYLEGRIQQMNVKKNEIRIKIQQLCSTFLTQPTNSTANSQDGCQNLPRLIELVQCSFRQKLNLLEMARREHEQMTKLEEKKADRRELFTQLNEKLDYLRQQQQDKREVLPVDVGVDDGDINQALMNKYLSLVEQNKMLKQKLKTNVKILYDVTQQISVPQGN